MRRFGNWSGTILRSQIPVHRNYAPEVPPVSMDRELMERVFYNLLLNAAQASPANAAITAKSRLIDNFAEVSILDRGAGIQKEHLESIFNPFFTTKSNGVGLGLAIVSKIVDEHGGSIRVESEPGEGSVFRVILPIEYTELHGSHASRPRGQISTSRTVDD